MPRKSRTRGSATVVRRSRNSSIRSRRKVTLHPIGMPSRSLKVAIDRFALVTTGCWPVIAVKSAAAASAFLLSCTASPTPILTTIFSRRGTCIGFLYPNSCISAGRTVVSYCSCRRALAISSPVDDLARAAGEPDLAAILENLVPDPRRLARLRVDMRDVRDVDRQLLLDDTAGLAHVRPGMPLRDVHPLDDDPLL